MHRYAAVVLAGGAGRRLAGPGKPRLAVGGRAMLARVLDAVADATPRVVVEPAAGELPPDVVRTSEQPAGGGPVAGIVAGLAVVASTAPAAATQHPPGAGRTGYGTVAVLAADQPFVTQAALATLRAALDSTVDGAVFVDAEGRRQLLCGVWWTAALLGRLAELGDPTDRAVRELAAGLRVAELRWTAADPPPWYDCDTEAELRQAREWATGAG